MPRLPLAASAATLALGALVMVLAVRAYFRRGPGDADLGRLRAALGAFGAVTLVTGVVVAAMFAFPQPPKTVRELYVHAIQDNDRDVAWGLLCVSDRQRVSRDAFDGLVAKALADLGGGIEEVHPTRGAYEWTGVNGKRVYLAPKTSGESRPCIRLGGSPLGE
jgi:hypothetical protein